MQRSSKKKRRSPPKRKFRMGAEPQLPQCSYNGCNMPPLKGVLCDLCPAGYRLCQQHFGDSVAHRHVELILFIRTSRISPVFTVKLPLESTVYDLKNHLYYTKNYKIDRQLIHVTRELKNDQALIDFNGKILHLFLRPIRLTFQNFAGKQYIIDDVTGTASIRYLKERLAFDITTDELRNLGHRASREEFLDRVVTPGRIILLLGQNLVLNDANEIEFYDLQDVVIHIVIDPRSQQEDLWATFTYSDAPRTGSIPYYSAYGMRPRRKKSLRKTKKSLRKTKKSSRK